MVLARLVTGGELVGDAWTAVDNTSHSLLGLTAELTAPERRGPRGSERTVCFWSLSVCAAVVAGSKRVGR